MAWKAMQLNHGAIASDLLRTGFSVVTQGSSEHVIVRLEGDLDMATTPDLERTLAAALAHAPARITIDLSRLEFIDSTGIGALIDSLRRADDQGCAFSLRSPSRSVMKVLKLTGVDQMVHIEQQAS